MNWYIVDDNEQVINFVVWDGITHIEFGGTPVLEEDYIKQHPEFFSESDNVNII